jgi:hypothetical protein
LKIVPEDEVWGTTKGGDAVFFLEEDESWGQTLSGVIRIGYDKVFDLDVEADAVVDFLMDCYFYIAKLERQEKPRRKPSPHAKYREACQETADRIWNVEKRLINGRAMTSREMARQPELIEASRRPDKTLYTGKTVAKWINVHNPNRKPGRRPGT